MTNETYASVWDLVCDTPEEAANMKFRSKLTIALQDYIEKSGLSQAKLAKLFGVTQPRVSDLRRGKIGLFALDALVNMAAAANMQVEVRVSAAPAERSVSTEAIKKVARAKPTTVAKKAAPARKVAAKAPARKVAAKAPVRRIKTASSSIAHTR
jgi:predicted XRE-type DNA-binding protein